MTTTVRRIFYSRAWAAIDGLAGMQDGGPAPVDWLRNTDHPVTAWATGGTVSPNLFGQLRFQATQTVFAPSHQVIGPVASPISAFRIPKHIVGGFATGNYDFSASVAATVNTGTVSGRMHFNLYRGTSRDGAGATRVNSADIVGTTVTALTPVVAQQSTASVSINQINLADEFLFLVLEWEVTSPGSAGDGVVLVPGAKTFFRTAAFTLPSWAPIPQYEEIDFTGAGFDSDQDSDLNAYSDVTRDSWNVNTSRGRTFNAQALPKTETGRIESTFTNQHGVYSRTNVNSPLYGNLKPKRALRARIVAPIDQVYFTGETDNLTPAANTNLGIGTANLTGLSEFIELSDNAKIKLASIIGVDTGTAKGLILDQVKNTAGNLVWPVGRRRIETGDVDIGFIATLDVKPEQVIEALDNDELGTTYPGADGFFVAENRHYRRDTLRCQVSAITFSDDPEIAPPSFYYASIKTENPPRLHFDRVKIDFTPSFVIDSVDPVVVFGAASNGLGIVGGIPLQPGESRRMTFNPFVYPWTFNQGIPVNNVTPLATNSSYYIVEWMEPIVQTGAFDPDVSQVLITGVPAADVYISNIVHDAQSITITLSNSNPDTTAVIFEVYLLARRGKFGAPVKADIGSGIHEYPLPGKDYTSIAAASTAGRYLLSYLSVDREWVTITVPCAGNPELLALLMGMEISSRYRVIATEERTGFAMDQEFFLENIKWNDVSPGQFTATILGSGCLPNNQDDIDVEIGLPAHAGIYYTMNEGSGDVKDSLSTAYHLTRLGTTPDVGVVGPGQKFLATEARYLFNATNGLPDSTLTGDWEWNGFMICGPITGDVEYILLKDVGDPVGAYGMKLTPIDSLHRYISAYIQTEDGVFSLPSNGFLMINTEVIWLRLMHNAALKKFSYSVNMGPLVSLTYTGTPLSTRDGIIFGGTTTLGTLPLFDNWYKASDLLGIFGDGDEVTSWLDRSGNGNDAVQGSISGNVKFHLNELLSGPIVRFEPGHLRIPEIGYTNIQMFMIAKFTSHGFFHTNVLRSSAGVGPNYGFGRTATDELYVHAYSVNNTAGVKKHSHLAYAWPQPYAVYSVNADWALSVNELWVNNVSQTMDADGTNLTGASGIDPDNAATMDVAEIIIAHDLSPTEIDLVTNYLMFVAGLGGATIPTQTFNGILDEWAYYTAILSDIDAAGVYNNGLGIGLTGPSPNAFVPPSPPTNPIIVPSGGTADQPLAANTDQLFFNTDLFGGTLQRWNGSAWVNVAPGLLQDIPKALIAAKGDLLVGAADNTPDVLSVGDDGQLLAADSGAPDGLAWIDPPPPAIPESLIDAKGDLIVGAADDLAARLTVGANGKILTARSGETLGIAWEDVPPVGKYEALVYTTDGVDFEFIADGDGEPVYVLRDLE